MELSGRVALITGATGGLGQVVARAFGQRGAGLALLSTDQAKLDALAEQLALPAERLLAQAADLRDPQSLQSALQAITARLGSPQIVIHLVGGWVGGKGLEASDSTDLESMLAQHVWTTWHLLRACLPGLTASGWGRVIVVSSPVASRPAARSGAYAAAKAAQEALLLTLAEEGRPHGVTANILQVRTIDVEHKRERAPAPANADWTTPEELCAAMLYLCSAEAGMVNGARLPLFGRGG